jgi:hypothetical protein
MAMNELDLLRDLEAAQARAREAMDLLEAAGVSVTAFMTSGWPGIERVATVGRLWHPHPSGTNMVVLPAWLGPGPLYHDDPLLVDLIAFTVDLPEVWLYRDGKPGLVLGDDHLEQAIQGAAPIRLFDSPLAWLRAGSAGSVVLDHTELRHERTPAGRCLPCERGGEHIKELGQ